MRTLVTGGNGYLGKSFGHSLRDSEDLILSYDRKVNIPNIKENYVQVQGDINDKLKIIELMKHFQIDSVVHLAALKSVTESADNAKAYFMTNVEGTKSIFEASEMCGIKNFVFASTAAVYGQPNSGPVTEQHATNPTNYYGETKLLAENYLTKNFFSAELNLSILRFFNVAGSIAPKSNEENYSGLFDQIHYSLINNIPVNIYGNNFDTSDGTAERDYVSISDTAIAIYQALVSTPSHHGKVMNICSSKAITVNQVILEFEKNLNRKLLVSIQPERSGEIARIYGSGALARKLIDFSARDQLEDMVRSYSVIAKDYSE